MNLFIYAFHLLLSKFFPLEHKPLQTFRVNRLISILRKVSLKGPIIKGPDLLYWILPPLKAGSIYYFIQRFLRRDVIERQYNIFTSDICLQLGHVFFKWALSVLVLKLKLEGLVHLRWYILKNLGQLAVITKAFREREWEVNVYPCILSLLIYEICIIRLLLCLWQLDYFLFVRMEALSSMLDLRVHYLFKIRLLDYCSHNLTLFPWSHPVK